MTNCDGKSLIGQRMEFYKIFELTTLHPFLLYVICDVGLGDTELERVFDILESYTLRRMLCCNGKGGLKNYNQFFARVIKHFQGKFSLDGFIEYLNGEVSDTTRYPKDQEIRDAVYTRFDSNPLIFPDKETIIFPHNQYMKAALSGLWVHTAGQIKKDLFAIFYIALKWKNKRITSIAKK